MTTLKQTAKEYVAPATKNIADLEKVSINIELQTQEAKDKDNNPFTYQYFELEGVKYRVPNTVIDQLKGFIEMKPNLEYIRVLKKGSGMNTQYQVVPLD